MVVATLSASAQPTEARPAQWNKRVKPLDFHGSNFFRLRLCLSLILQRPIRISNLRQPGNLGVSDRDSTIGLAEYEDSLLQLLHKVTDGGKISIAKSGTAVTFFPGQIVGGLETGEPIIHDCSCQRNLSYYLEALAMLAPFARRTLKVRLRGATHGGASSDTTVDHFMGVMVSLFQRMGVTGSDDAAVPLSVKVIKKGLAPGGGGEVELICGNSRVVKPFKLTNIGRVKRIRGRAFVCGHKALCQGAINRARGVFNELLPDVWIFDSSAKAGLDGFKSHGYALTVIAETMKGVTYGASGVLEEESLKNAHDSSDDLNVRATLKQRLELAKEGEGEESENLAGLSEEAAEAKKRLSEMSPSEKLGCKIAQRLIAEICLSGVVDSTYQHIPVLFMALADEIGPSEIKLGLLTPYTVAVLRHLRDFCSASFVFTATDEEESPATGNEETLPSDEAVPRKKLVVLRCVGVGVRNVQKRTF